MTITKSGNDSLLPLFAAGAHEIIFGIDGNPPLPKPIISAAAGTPAHKDEKDILDKWNNSNHAGIQTISLNLDVGRKHIIQQHKEKNVRELWYAIRALHKRNTRGQRGLAKMKWMAFRQGGKMTLSEYISKFNSLHTGLLLTGVPFDGELNCCNSRRDLIPNVSCWQLWALWSSRISAGLVFQLPTL